ncbi:MAG: hypothetical protein OXU79_14815 [Gemmatimonadota bacterium]|nr:hypothetical protein [Gemmatimonadota bacterium]
MTREFVARSAVVFILFCIGAVTLKFLFGDPLAPTYQFGFRGFVMDIALGILTISVILAVSILAIGSVVIFLRRRTGGRTRRADAGTTDAVNARLDELERRMTDVQDVLISMDEKLGRPEGNRPGG